MNEPRSLWPDPDCLGGLTDLYQLTMMAGYHSAGLDGSRATFELFVRRLPEGRSYLVFAGLEQAAADLARLRFDRALVREIRRWPVFAGVDPAWFETLSDLRFRGDLWAVPEGTVVFAGEPIARVEASLPEAQWVETFLIASLVYPTLVASKASRIVEAARGRPLYDFGTRRGHGPLAGLISARAAYLAGFAGTSNVEAAARLGIPASGTMAHSWVQAFPTEAEAFAAFTRVYPGATVLIDTYDLAEGARLAAATEPRVGGVRIDSGDLLEGSRLVRSVLDGAGRPDVSIVGSGDLDERRIEALVHARAPIDAFGVGTELITSRDAPALSMVYKLVEQDGAGRVKLSPGKKSYPGAKQFHRVRDGDGLFDHDEVTGADESHPNKGLLQRVLRSGQPVGPWPSLDEIRSECSSQVASLSPSLRSLDPIGTYPITYSDALEDEAKRLGVIGPKRVP